MKFVDEAKIYTKGGDGGRGCVSFRREKYVPRGGPNGGDGGKGGDVIVRALRNHRTLLDLKFQQHHKAKNGGHGGGSNKTGRNSDDVIVAVPVGTIVKDAQTGGLLADLVADGEECIVAKGGIGGKGNAFFATSTNQAPHYAQPGMPGEERDVILELKLLADVGIIGFPNVGKSTFISKVSAAKPKIADYPFTTLTPHLGVVKYGKYESFVIADIPGLIEGAHRGQGMGIRFLRHIERTAVLLHILDISDETTDEAWRKFEAINRELALFRPDMIEKPQIVAVNKIDLSATRERLQKEIDFFKEKGINLLSFSAITGKGLSAVINAVIEKLQSVKAS
ncbi:MAG: GTPase ObgE [Deltaproteobacteria bacterium]|nr:GTPase ObgE [Deltaproteobacteria bacterium]